MSKIRCIVIEDEPLAAKVLTDYIADVPFLELQMTFRDAILATDFLRQHSTDLIFLDIHLPRLKGMAFLKTLSNPPAVIITTAYHQYAVEGFNLDVKDYLLKPIEFERFLIAVNKVHRAQAAAPNAEPEKDYLFVNVQKKKVKILFSDIVYVESQREYIKIVTTSGPVHLKNEHRRDRGHPARTPLPARTPVLHHLPWQDRLIHRRNGRGQRHTNSDRPRLPRRDRKSIKTKHQ
ncbi:LytR/AlgR family response regulator transcription factor [Puia sp. P3]|uniref:LytR/AlgR family response regulator transcription factor n=1 Tax=Puia sp. P3 TaxID=3423952 RepID=UPI003D6798F0